MGLRQKATIRSCCVESLPDTVQNLCGACTVRPLSLPSAQACATEEKLKCAQPQPQEADPLQVRNPS